MANTYDAGITRHIRLRCAHGIAFGDWIWNPDRIATISDVVFGGVAALWLPMIIVFRLVNAQWHQFPNRECPWASFSEPQTPASQPTSKPTSKPTNHRKQQQKNKPNCNQPHPEQEPRTEPNTQASTLTKPTKTPYTTSQQPSNQPINKRPSQYLR